MWGIAENDCFLRLVLQMEFNRKNGELLMCNENTHVDLYWKFIIVTDVRDRPDLANIYICE